MMSLFQVQNRVQSEVTLCEHQVEGWQEYMICISVHALIYNVQKIEKMYDSISKVVIDMNFTKALPG